MDKLTAGNRMKRCCWALSWTLFFRGSPAVVHAWRRMLLRCFGARIGAGARVYPSARVWAPWNLVMGDGSCLGPGVDCYSVDSIHVGVGATVSQNVFLCTASHDIRSPGFELKTAPIRIGAYAWVAAGAYVGPAVIVGEGAVVGARACVFKNVPPWTVVGGNPARQIGVRSRSQEEA